jgi:hypothetical protein
MSSRSLEKPKEIAYIIEFFEYNPLTENHKSVAAFKIQAEPGYYNDYISRVILKETGFYSSHDKNYATMHWVFSDGHIRKNTIEYVFPNGYPISYNGSNFWRIIAEYQKFVKRGIAEDIKMPERAMAFAMGSHRSLGANSQISQLNPELIQMIVNNVQHGR